MFVAVCRLRYRGTPFGCPSARTFSWQRRSRFEAVSTRPGMPLPAGNPTSEPPGKAVSTKPRAPIGRPIRTGVESLTGMGVAPRWRRGCVRGMSRIAGAGEPSPRSNVGRPRVAERSHPLVGARRYCAWKPRICGGLLHDRSHREARKVGDGALTAIRSMRYRPPSGVCALVAGVSF